MWTRHSKIWYFTAISLVLQSNLMTYSDNIKGVWSDSKCTCIYQCICITGIGP